MGKTYVKVSGTWKQVKKTYVKVNGVWKSCQKVYVKVNGVWKDVTGGGDRGVFGGGVGYYDEQPNEIEYITISSPGNAQDFGDFIADRYGVAAVSNGVNNRGVFAGSLNTNTMEYITISSPSNANFFGYYISNTDIAYLAGTSNGANDRGVFGGGLYTYNYTDDEYVDWMRYITISSLGNAQGFTSLSGHDRCSLAATSNGTNDRGLFAGGGYDYLFGQYWHTYTTDNIYYLTISSLSSTHYFGDLSRSAWKLAATSNGVNDRGIFGGGEAEGVNTTIYISHIDYITISSLGDAQSFGDLTDARSRLAATSNGTNDRGVFGGGNNVNYIEYITISSSGNAHYFGDLSGHKTDLAATSNA